MRSLWIIVGVIVIVAAIFVSIRFTQKPGLQERVIKIGAVLPLTGNLAVIGEQEKAAILLAQKTVKGAAKVKVYIQDNKGDPKEAVTIVNRLHSFEGVKIFLISPSPAILATIPIILNFDGILFAITSMPDIGDGKNVFHISPNSKDEMIQLAEWLDSQKIHEIAFIYPNNDLGQIIYKTFLSKFRGHLVFSESYQVGSKDFRDILTKLKDLAGKLEWISFQGYPGDIPIFIKQAREMGIKSKFITSMATTWPETVKVLTLMRESPIFMAPSCMIESLQSPNARKFVELFVAETKIPPNWDAYYTFEVMRIIGQFATLQTWSIPELRVYLLNKTHEGITGKIRINLKGEIEVPLVAATLQDGRIVLWGGNKYETTHGSSHKIDVQ